MQLDQIRFTSRTKSDGDSYSPSSNRFCTRGREPQRESAAVTEQQSPRARQFHVANVTAAREGTTRRTSTLLISMGVLTISG